MAIGPAAGAAESFEALRGRTQSTSAETSSEDGLTPNESTTVTNEEVQSGDLTTGSNVNTTA